jgi:uncharacterized protein with FMN-binding domain
MVVIQKQGGVPMEVYKKIPGIMFFLFLQTVSLFSVGLKERTPSALDLSRLQDGVYQGQTKHWPVAVKVEVRVLNSRIQDIVILRHREGRGESAERICADIIAAQSLDVDIVSGATVSSRTILEAVETALWKAIPEEPIGVE